MKTIVLMSGGLDSTTLVYWLLSQGDDVRALSVDYGQRHGIELEAARQIATRDLSIPHVYIDLRQLAGVMHGSSQTDPTVPVPHGHYEEESMKLTVVPNRNMVLLSIAAAYAISEKADRIAYAAHAGDHAIYPDCRPAFVDALSVLLQHVHFTPLQLHTPFLHMKKSEIVSLGRSLGVPFHKTWSCYEDGIMHCGKCGTCTERKEAFEKANVLDPTRYKA